MSKLIFMRKYDWSEERVREASLKANCWFNCLELLGVPKVGHNYRTLKNKVEEYGIDVSHFDYHYAHLHNGLHYTRQLANRDDSEIFKLGAKVKTDNLKKEYIRRFMGNNPKCEECGITEWNGKELVFHIHHLDGNHSNHARENLRLLCPNCHSQTETYANKKREL